MIRTNVISSNNQLRVGEDFVRFRCSVTRKRLLKFQVCWRIDLKLDYPTTLTLFFEISGVLEDLKLDYPRALSFVTHMYDWLPGFYTLVWAILRK